MRNKRKPVLKLGVTGGIGCGKTSVCKVFNLLGIPVFASDPVAREIIESDNGIKHRMNSIAGKNLYINGTLDSKELASLIFNNGDILKKVNSLVHPIVFDHYLSWVKKQSAPYVIMEAAILHESGASKLVDRVVTVVAPLEERVERVMKRNDLSRVQVLDRIRNQMDDHERIKLSDYVINNSENDMIIPAVLQIHNELTEYINNKA